MKGSMGLARAPGVPAVARMKPAERASIQRFLGVPLGKIVR
jgi:hypothetical protein